MVVFCALGGLAALGCGDAAEAAGGDAVVVGNCTDGAVTGGITEPLG